jgi:hypothetical protein
LLAFALLPVAVGMRAFVADATFLFSAAQALLLFAAVVIATAIARLVVATFIRTTHGLVATHDAGWLGPGVALRPLHGFASRSITLRGQLLLLAWLAFA